MIFALLRGNPLCRRYSPIKWTNITNHPSSKLKDEKVTSQRRLPFFKRKNHYLNYVDLSNLEFVLQPIKSKLLYFERLFIFRI